MNTLHKMGWTPDKPDVRDARLAVAAPRTFPRDFSLASLMPPYFNQGNIGSCVWQGITAQHMFCQMRQPGGCTFKPSVFYGYYWTRYAEDTIAEDAGCMPRDGFKVVAKRGLPCEQRWPEVDDGKRLFIKPPAQCDTEAEKHQGLQYATVPQTENDLKTCLYGNGTVPYGFPVGFGATLYTSFESEKTKTTGLVSIPHFYERQIGGHYEVIIGWKTTTKGETLWQVRNSWGQEWGDLGCAWFPNAYLLGKDCSDFRKLTLVEEDKSCKSWIEIIPSEIGKTWITKETRTVESRHGKKFTKHAGRKNDGYTFIPNFTDTEPAEVHDEAGETQQWDDGTKMTYCEWNDLIQYRMEQSWDARTRRWACLVGWGLMPFAWPVWLRKGKG